MKEIKTPKRLRKNVIEFKKNGDIKIFGIKKNIKALPPY